MSLFKFLRLQKLEPNDSSSELDYYESSNIDLDEPLDSSKLECFLNDAIDDMRSDESWSFTSDD